MLGRAAAMYSLLQQRVKTSRTWPGRLWIRRDPSLGIEATLSRLRPPISAVGLEAQRPNNSMEPPPLRFGLYTPSPLAACRGRVSPGDRPPRPSPSTGRQGRRTRRGEGGDLRPTRPGVGHSMRF